MNNLMTTSASELPILRLGHRGEQVKYLQDLLNYFGYNLTVDGIFGSRTEAAVKQFQRSYGLVADGIVGANTWGVMHHNLHESEPIAMSA